MLKVGKLYSCPEYYLFLYPDKDTAAAAGGALPVARRGAAGAYWTREAATAAAAAAYWTRELGKPVSYCNPKTPLLVLSVDKKYVEVLAGDKVGWIINEDWLNIKEIVDAAA